MPLAEPNCPEKCGELTIPYLFGIGEGSFYGSDSNFNFACNETTGVTTMGQNLERIAHNAPWLHLVKFTISSRHNRLVAIGCDDYVYLKGLRNGIAYWMGCMTDCISVKDPVNDCRFTL
ncbi:hypothetical protein Ancab_008411 [Ancistrocladus abbreviatus]